MAKEGHQLGVILPPPQPLLLGFDCTASSVTTLRAAGLLWPNTGDPTPEFMRPPSPRGSVAVIPGVFCQLRDIPVGNPKDLLNP